MAPLLPIVSSAPVLPPFGLLFLLAWRLLRPGLWPVWVGAPLGLFDDLLSGQPIGSAIALWSLALILIDIVEQRFLWRNLWQDWLLAALVTLLAAGLRLYGLGSESIWLDEGYSYLFAKDSLRMR